MSFHCLSPRPFLNSCGIRSSQDPAVPSKSTSPEAASLGPAEATRLHGVSRLLLLISDVIVHLAGIIDSSVRLLVWLAFQEGSLASPEMLSSMLEDTSAETSERVIAVLGPRLEAISRLVVGLHLESAIRGDRRVRSKLEAAKCLDKVIGAAVPDTQVGPDNSLDVAVLRAQVYAAESARAAAERELAKEAFRRENETAVTSSTMKELTKTRRQLKIAKEIAARYLHDAQTMSAVAEQHKELYQRMENRVKAAEDSYLVTLVLSDDDVEIVDVLPAVPPPPAGSREDASPGGVTGDTDGLCRGPVLRAKAASSEFRSALLLEALEADDDDVLGLTELSPTRNQSTSLTQAEPPAASTTRSSSSRVASNSQVKVSAASVTRSASSRGVSRKQVKPPVTPGRRSSTTRMSRPTSQVVATLSSMPGSDRGSQRPLPVHPPVAGVCPIVRVSKQVAKRAQPFISPAFSRPGAANCWIR
ncbi:unnamed protein product [Phytophthora fragariaefolia]|uniref:Unnamed protein product n=1 Tax=Phytophthora fragariaefolia TaxID=1490495 RepID=A0A9W7CNX0_9STRA|nr:unnamed protein product [Phytophthora fragariaefolia]